MRKKKRDFLKTPKSYYPDQTKPVLPDFVIYSQFGYFLCNQNMCLANSQFRPLFVTFKDWLTPCSNKSYNCSTQLYNLFLDNLLPFSKKAFHFSVYTWHFIPVIITILLKTRYCKSPIILLNYNSKNSRIYAIVP